MWRKQTVAISTSDYMPVEKKAQGNIEKAAKAVNHTKVLQNTVI